MKRKLEDLSESEFNSLHSSGMLWELYPESDGIYRHINKTMKIENLKVGDKIKYHIGYGGFKAKIKSIKLPIFTVWNQDEFLVEVHQDNIICKLEPQTTYKEIPIEKPKSIKFNFIPMSYSINNGRFSDTVMETEGYVSDRANSAQRLTIPLVPNGLIPNIGKTYSIEIKEI